MVDVADPGRAAPLDNLGKLKGFWLAAVFTATIFLSATLLFSVQPMFTKLVVPLLGGSSGVWNTAMVFFQALLLGGYIYAHLLSKYLPLPIQGLIHLAVIGLGFIALPLAIGAGVEPPATGMPTLWLLGLFAATVGLPFFALSANAPLLQNWFAQTSHQDANDPYFLYAASNAGSLIILCAYPVLIEPMLRLGEQTQSWAWGYGALLAAIAVTILFALRSRNAGEHEANEVEIAATRITLKRAAFWVFLAFIPSSLMLGVTSWLTNNIASTPMLWIVPLSLYLLTFVIVFSKRAAWAGTVRLAWMFPWVCLLALAVTEVPMIPTGIRIGVSLLAFFLIALFCHARLVEDRPPASQLTNFYMLMSLGGVLGGVFNALIAPVLFTTVIEYGIVLIVAGFVLPLGASFASQGRARWQKLALGLGLALAAYITLKVFGVSARWPLFIVAALILFGVSALDLPDRHKSFLRLTVIMIAVLQVFTQNNAALYDRSFYSAFHVAVVEMEGGTTHQLVHGDTVHGIQIQEDGLQNIPLGYYARGGVIETAIAAVRSNVDNPAIAVVGLGAGAMACLEEPGERWTYFEIDPKIVEMARDPKLFSFLSRCAPNADIRTGDARLKLDTLAAGSQDLIVIDAFSSNSIPPHLVTREALEIYRSRLKPGGVILFHTSNRSLDVSSVVALIAEDSGLSTRFISHEGSYPDGFKKTQLQADGMLVGEAAQIASLTQGDDRWRGYRPSEHVGVWTDDYTSIIGAMRAQSANDARLFDID